MSWTRRILILVAFAVMLGGVALMVTQQDELWLALSLAGFVLVLAAVPSLQRERAATEDRAEETEAEAEAAGEELAAPRQRTGNVMLLPREDAQADGRDGEGVPAVAGEEPGGVEGGDPATREHPALAAAGEAVPSEGAAPSDASAAPGDEPVDAADPEAGTAAPAPRFAPSQQPRPALAGRRQRAGAERSRRNVAIAGAAAAAAAWVWRRRR